MARTAISQRRKSVLHYPYSLESSSITSPLNLGSTFDPSSGDWTLRVPFKLSVLPSVQGSSFVFYSQVDGNGTGSIWMNVLSTNDNFRTNFDGSPFDWDYIFDLKWHEYVLRWNSVTEDLTLSVDGATEQVQPNVTMRSADGVHKIFTNKAGGSGAIGKIGPPLLITRHITDEEVADMYYDGVIPSDNQNYFLPLTEGSSDPQDISGNSNDATLGSNTWNATDTPGKARTAITQNRTSVS